MLNLLRTLTGIVSHPLNRGQPVAALARWARWQLGSRLLPGPAVVPFVDEILLIVTRGMHGVTGNLYSGLDEFEDMALVLHALRAGDLFIDIGANVGAYTLLAAATHARVMSVEPIPRTFNDLCRNIGINGLADQVQLLNLGLGRVDGRLSFTGDLGTVNHVLAPDEVNNHALDVPVRTLDKVLSGQAPTLIKIDVEGYETEVLAGGDSAVNSPGLLAMIIELNGSSSRYGFDEEYLHRSLLARGFSTWRYRPFERNLVPLSGTRNLDGNTLYVRDASKLAQRVREAPHYHLAIGLDI